MNNSIKNGLIVVGIAVLAFMLISWNKKPKTEAPKTLTEEEKNALFQAATNYYRGGAAPPIEVEQEFQRMRDEAMSKIKALGLEKELAEYVAKKQAEAEDVPEPNFPSAGPMSGF